MNNDSLYLARICISIKGLLDSNIPVDRKSAREFLNKKFSERTYTMGTSSRLEALSAISHILSVNPDNKLLTEAQKLAESVTDKEFVWFKLECPADETIIEKNRRSDKNKLNYILAGLIFALSLIFAYFSANIMGFIHRLFN